MSENNERGKQLSKKNGALLAVGILLVLVLAIELILPIIGYDFEDPTPAMARVPIFFQQPTVPVGEAFYRRPGPQQWTGRVLHDQLVQLGAESDAYIDEPVITVSYDEDGFRNPEGMNDWEIAVVGDSCTEAGYLPYDDLLTTQLGRLLNCRVRNLGVSRTGPRTHVAYLKEFAKAPSTTHAVLAFFEGNDWTDLLIEEREIQAVRNGSVVHQDLLKRHQPQSSFVKALFNTTRRTLAGRAERERPLLSNAYYVTHGQRTPIAINYAPPGSSQLPRELNNSLRQALELWADTSRELRLQPWLLYLPCKHRVLHGHLEFDRSVDRRMSQWKPTDFPKLVQAFCDETGIQFVDATPVLTAETRAGKLTYNAIYDSHLNNRGSTHVAQTLARALRP